MRVSRASIRIDGVESGSMGRGFVVLVGVKEGDGPQEAAYLAKKCAEMRIFEDENEKMNLNLEQVGGGMLVVSNFTLYADCSHETAIPVYEAFLAEIRQRNIPLLTGKFGAYMEIDHVNDGPVTLILDTDQMMKR